MRGKRRAEGFNAAAKQAIFRRTWENFGEALVRKIALKKIYNKEKKGEGVKKRV